MLVVSPARQKTLRKLTDSLRLRKASPSYQDQDQGVQVVSLA
jgi:hypothetical protein